MAVIHKTTYYQGEDNTLSSLFYFHLENRHPPKSKTLNIKESV